jgi:Photosynthetic reaction centre cytochrome C subunit
MHQYEADLGVSCEFCHTAPDPTTHRADRASDANPMKDKARFMIQMTADLNNKYLAQLPDRHDTDPVTCGTCHRGEKHPSVFAPTARPDATRPPPPPLGAPPN